jgi:tetratricopeptide (TPR) repeat protein
MRFDSHLLRRPIAVAFSACAALILSAVTFAQETTPPAGESAAAAATGDAAASEFNAQEAKDKGDAALKAGDYPAALAAYNDLIVNAAKANPQAAQEMALVGYVGRGRALAGLKEYEAALEDFKYIIDNDPNNVAALIARGTLNLDINRPDEALVDFQTSVKAQRGNLEAMFGLGKALVTVGKAEEAVQPLTRVITADPKNAEAYRLRGTAYINQFKTKQSIEDLQQAISLNPDDHESYLTLGMIYMRAEEYQNAVEQFAKSIEHYKPKTGQEDVPFVGGYINLATAYTELGKNTKDEAAQKAAYQSAIDECEKLLKLLDSKNPAHAQVRAATIFTRGVAERMLGEYVTAIKSFTEALELNPELGDAYFRRGICFHLLGEDRMAISDFEQASHMAYGDPRFSLWAGFTYAKLKDYHKALRAYGDAIAASDRYTPAYYNRGLAYLALGDYEKAIKDFNDALRLDPTRADYYYKRGIAQEKLRDYQKAAESFATALEFDSQHADAYRHMSDVMTSLGRTELSDEYKLKAEQLRRRKPAN